MQKTLAFTALLNAFCALTSAVIPSNAFAQTSPISRVTIRRHHLVLNINWSGLPLEYDDAKGDIVYGGTLLPPNFYSVELGAVFNRFRDENNKATFGKLQQIEGSMGRIVFDYYDSDSAPAILGKLKWIEVGTVGDRIQFEYDEKTGKPITILYKRERMSFEYFPDYADKDLAEKLHTVRFLSNNYQFEYYNSQGDEFSHGNLFSVDYNNNKILFEYTFDRIRPLGVCNLPIFMEIR
jgi:hypothetical protein